ncbi:MAG: hypothetical protein WEE66_02085 [Actinomycetota bacterium]
MKRKRRDRRRVAQAERLRETALAGLREAGEREDAVLSWGYGIHQQFDPVIGPHVTDAVYVLMKGGFLFQYLEEVPRELLSPRVLASGASPSDWKAMAQEVHGFYFGRLDGLEARNIDDRCDILFIPEGAKSEADFQGFGVTTPYGGLSVREIEVWIVEG